jgi:hypothetical protein
MGRRAKLKQERKKIYYLDKIKNSPIGKFVDYKLLNMALDIPEIRKIYDLMDNFNQDLWLSDDASFYFHDVIEKFSRQKILESTSIEDRTIWADFPNRCLENARCLHIINTHYETGVVPSIIEKEWLEKATELTIYSLKNNQYIPSTLYQHDDI